MAGRTWKPTKSGARDLNRAARKGMTVYTVATVSRRVAPYEDSALYNSHTFDYRSPITGNWLAGHLSAEGLLGQYGTVYEQPPAGIRNVATPGRQVAPPLGSNDYEGRLDDAEIRGLEKHVADGSDPRNRRGLRGWQI